MAPDRYRLVVSRPLTERLAGVDFPLASTKGTSAAAHLSARDCRVFAAAMAMLTCFSPYIALEKTEPIHDYMAINLSWRAPVFDEYELGLRVLRA